MTTSKDVSSIVKRMRAMLNREPPNYCCSILLPAEEASALLAEIDRLQPMAESWESYEATQDRKAAAGLTDETAAELHWPLIDTALQGAANALPVLFTMLTKAGLREGAMVADEINGNVLCAIKQLAHGRRPALKTSAPQAGSSGSSGN